MGPFNSLPFGLIQPEGGIPPDLQKSMMINALLAGTGPLLQNTYLPQNFGSRLSAALQNVYGAMGQQSAALQDSAMKQAQMQHLNAQSMLAMAQANAALNPKENVGDQVKALEYAEKVKERQAWPQQIADILSYNQFPGKDTAGIAKSLLAMEPSKGQEMIAQLTNKANDTIPMMVGGKQVDVPIAQALMSQDRELARKQQEAQGAENRALREQIAFGNQAIAQQGLDLRKQMQQQKEDVKANAKQQVNGILSDMKDNYEQLSNMGAIVDTSKSAVENVKARASASGAGQTIGKIFGTQAQSIRNQINQQKPLLIHAIRQASQMGARGLDSEKELQFYLQAATDERLDLQTNMNALRVLDKAYGLGQISNTPTKKVGGQATSSGNPFTIREVK